VVFFLVMMVPIAYQQNVDLLNVDIDVPNILTKEHGNVITLWLLKF
jgi:hypothetical protein